MITALLATFFIAHGLVHVAVWVPQPRPDQPAPFVPSYSGLLTAAHVAEHTSRVLSLALAGIREWVASLPPAAATRVATFDTKVAKARRLPGAARAAAKTLRSRGFGRPRL